MDGVNSILPLEKFHKKKNSSRPAAARWFWNRSVEGDLQCRNECWSQGEQAIGFGKGWTEEEELTNQANLRRSRKEPLEQTDHDTEHGQEDDRKKRIE